MNPRDELARTIRRIAARGWSLGTGGNYSVTLSHQPLRLLMSPSGVDKSGVMPRDLLEVGSRGEVVAGDGSASAETLIHVAIVELTGAGSVLHTHSVWNTLLSFRGDGFNLAGYEMLKALEGVTTHQHAEHIPILENSQDMETFSEEVRQLLAADPKLHAFLMKGHGLYTWGSTLFDARRHVEALEFLFEVEGRRLRGQ